MVFGVQTPGLQAQQRLGLGQELLMPLCGEELRPISPSKLSAEEKKIYKYRTWRFILPELEDVLFARVSFLKGTFFLVKKNR